MNKRKPLHDSLSQEGGHDDRQTNQTKQCQTVQHSEVGNLLLNYRLRLFQVLPAKRMELDPSLINAGFCQAGDTKRKTIA